jgi:phytanoyl-CoA hydroxylase
MITNEQHDFYLENGYIILEGVLDDEDFRPVREAMSETVDEIAATLYEAGRIPSLLDDLPFETRLAAVSAVAGEGSAAEFGRSWRPRKPGYFEIISNPKLLDIAEALCGPELIAHPVYNTRPMVPSSPHVIVPWHQDCSYLNYKVVQNQEIPAFWIPLVDVNEKMGCLQVAPRSKNKGLVSFHQEEYSGTGFIEIDFEHTDDMEIVVCEMKKGDVLIVDQMTYHRSTANTSDLVRWSIDIRYQDARLPTGFGGVSHLLRSEDRPEAVIDLDDFMNERSEKADVERSPLAAP